MPPCCIVYTSDETYLFPTVISAIQARRHASPDKADVMIFHLGVSAEAERDFAAICDVEGIRLMAIDPGAIGGANAMMSRLFLNAFVPPEYRHYLYLDGDVHIGGSLDPLIDAEVPPGRFFAATDPMTFMLAEDGPQSRDFASHMRSIGLTPEQAARYFNTGVLRINRDGWDDIGSQAWKMVREAPRAFRFPDQDPLNIVARERHMPMPLAWNFPIFMLNARVRSTIKPRIVHFMSNPKPWHGTFQPWGAKSYALYPAAVRVHPSLAKYNPAVPPSKRVRYHLQQNYKKVVETFAWGFTERRDRILSYEERTLQAMRA